MITDTLYKEEEGYLFTERAKFKDIGVPQMIDLGEVTKPNLILETIEHYLKVVGVDKK